MSKPEIKENAGGFRFQWAKEQIIIDVSRLRNRADGTRGEIIVRTTSPDASAPHLHQSTFSFTTLSTRDKLIKTLNSRYELDDWYSIIEQLCFYTLERMRRGAPVNTIKSTDEINKPIYLLSPLIIKNLPNVIFGDPSAAKSTVAVILSQVMQLPWEDNPLGLIAPTRSIRVLYLDWETDYNTIAWQTKTLERGMDLGYLELEYRSCGESLSQDAEQINKYIEETKTELVIIDSLGLAAGGELKDTQSPLNFYRSLRQMNVSSLILAHNSKDSESKNKSIYGNQYFTAQARNIWEIKKTQEPGSSEMDIALFHKKPPPFSKLQRPIGFKIIFDDSANTMSVQEQDPRNVDEFLKQMSNTERVFALLKSGPMTNEEMLQDLNISSANLRKATQRLKDRKLIIKVEDKWGLLRKE